MFFLSEDQVLEALNHQHWKTVPELREEIGVGMLRTGMLYGHLILLEREGEVESQWRVQPTGRRLEFRLTTEGMRRRIGLFEKERAPSGAKEFGLAHMRALFI